MLSRDGSGSLGREPTGRTPAPGVALGAICDLDASIARMRSCSSAVGRLRGMSLLSNHPEYANAQYPKPRRAAMPTPKRKYFICLHY